MKRADDAAENMMASKMNCAQSVLTAFCEQQGLPKALGLRLAMAFGGGMGRTGRTCGAVTGAYMVIGLRQELTPEKAAQLKDQVYNSVREFDRRFCARHGSTACKDLLGFDLSAPEGHKSAREKGLFNTICPRLVHDAVEILEEMEKGL